MKDRSQSQIAFEIFERFLDLGQQDIKLPELSGIFAAQIGAVRPFSVIALRRLIDALMICFIALALFARARQKFGIALEGVSTGVKLARGCCQPQLYNRPC